jgi:flagellar assembly protein FliH
MSSRIIRGDRIATGKVSVAPGNVSGVTSQEHFMDVEKHAFEQGYVEGERTGKQMGEAMLETICKRYDKGLVDLAIAHGVMVRLMEEETVRMAIEIARKIVQRELTMDPDLVVALTTATLKRVSGQQSILVRVSRQDFERVSAAIANVNSAVTVKDDPALERGDCLVDTGQTHVDNRVGSQIDVISRTLFDE